MLYSAACGEDMYPRSDFPVHTDVKGESIEGITDKEADPWKPQTSEEDEDTSITVTVVVSEGDDVLIEDIKLTDEKTEGVAKVIVVVKDKNGEPVVCAFIKIITVVDPTFYTKSPQHSVEVINLHVNINFFVPLIMLCIR